MGLANYTTTSRRVTPQMQPISGRTDQVQNNAGGYVFQVNDWDRLDRFLILGAEGGTYYVGERDLVKQNHDNLVKLIKEDGERVVNRIAEISESGRAPKNDPALFALALVFTHGDEGSKKTATTVLPHVARTGTHLFHFVHYVDNLRGWGRGLRDAVARWYTVQKADQLAYQVIKYQQRDGWSHRDVLRKAHPRFDEKIHQAIFRWIISGSNGLGDRFVARRHSEGNYGSVKQFMPQAIVAFEKAKAATSAKEIVNLIQDCNLPRECIPTQFLNDPGIWEALLQKMPMTAMIRNLAKMTAIGLAAPLSQASKLIVQRLGDLEYLRKSRVHPLAVLIAARQYAQGHGDKGSLAWSSVPAISQALDGAFYLTFGNVVPTGKNILYALDVSGSMSQGTVAGTPITPREAAAALALLMASTEQNYHIMGFSDTFVDLGIHPNMTLAQATRRTESLPFSGTDCALPMIWASQTKAHVDAFVVLTDNETWHGGIHPVQALKQYRDNFVPDAKLVVVGMTATDFTIADPNDKGSMDVVGFDTAAPAVISDFIRGFSAVDLQRAADEARKRVSGYSKEKRAALLASARKTIKSGRKPVKRTQRKLMSARRLSK